MTKIFESLQRLPDGKELVRWHLLDDTYQLIKPVERFLRFKQMGGSSVGTIKIYAEKLNAFWKYLDLKNLDWRDFTLRHMSEFGYWYLTGGILLDRTIVPSNSENIPARRNERTVNLALTVVTLFYEFHECNGTVKDKNLRQYRLVHGERQGGLLAGHIQRSPIGVKQVRYREPKNFPGCLTPEQIRTLIGACRTARDKLVLWLLADTGMRKGELLGLHQSDVDWTTRTLKIVRRDNPNHAYAKGQQRDISIANLLRDPEFCEIVTEYLEEEYPYEVVKRLGHDMLFVVLHKGSPSYGKALEPQNLNKLLKRLHQITGVDVDRLYPHLFRHSFATHNIKQGRRKGIHKEEITKIIQRQMGHKSINTTLTIYDHSFSEAEIVEEIERLTKK